MNLQTREACIFPMAYGITSTDVDQSKWVYVFQNGGVKSRGVDTHWYTWANSLKEYFRQSNFTIDDFTKLSAKELKTQIALGLIESSDFFGNELQAVYVKKGKNV